MTSRPAGSRSATIPFPVAQLHHQTCEFEESFPRTTTLDPEGDRVFDLVQVSGALVTFEPKGRPPIIGWREAALDRVERYYPSALLVKLSDEDARWLHLDEP